MISIISAMSKNHVIGKDNKLPWHLPADFAWFKQHTLNKTVIMGYNTYKSIGRALPHRQNIVLTRNPNLCIHGCVVVDTLDEAFKKAKSNEIMIIGGASIYEQCLPIADRLYLTIVDVELDGDAYFPIIDSTWKTIYNKPYKRDDNNQYAMEFKIMERIK